MQAQRWLGAVDEGTRHNVKLAVLRTLQSPIKPARRVSAQIIECIADVELPRNMWPDLVKVLVDSTQANNPPHLREAALETLGYVCETVVCTNVTNEMDAERAICRTRTSLCCSRA